MNFDLFKKRLRDPSDFPVFRHEVEEFVRTSQIYLDYAFDPFENIERRGLRERGRRGIANEIRSLRRRGAEVEAVRRDFEILPDINEVRRHTWRAIYGDLASIWRRYSDLKVSAHDNSPFLWLAHLCATTILHEDLPKKTVKKHLCKSLTLNECR